MWWIDRNCVRFIMPAIIDRSPVIVAVSSGGASPVLARLLRARLESLVPAAYGRLATLVSSFRDKVKAHFAPGARPPYFLGAACCKALWRRWCTPDAMTKRVWRLRNNWQARRLVLPREKCIWSAAGRVTRTAHVPTLRLMQQADVVVYDRLVSKQVLELVRRDAEKLYAGKERDNHAIPQEDINQLLVRLAKEGKRVLRLKVVIHSSSDVAVRRSKPWRRKAFRSRWCLVSRQPRLCAYSGIPLTHRDYSQAVVFVHWPFAGRHGESQLEGACPAEPDSGFLHGSAWSVGDLRRAHQPWHAASTRWHSYSRVRR